MTRGASKPRTRKLERWLLPIGLLALLLALWAWMSKGGSGVGDFPTPAEVVEGYKEQLRTPHGEHAPWLVKHVVASLFRVVSGFLLATALGIPLGLVLGWYTRTWFALNPLVQMMRPISPIAWIPMSILMFRNDDQRAVFLIFISSFFPVVVATTAAVHTIPAVYLRAAVNFGLRGWPLFKKVVLPAAFPQILTGLRIGMGVAWLVVVAAEMVAVQSGLGYLIIDARNMGLRYDLIVGTMILIGLIGLGLDNLLRSLQRLDQVRWGFSKRD